MKDELASMLTAIGPLISVAGAAASWYWAHKRFRWDAGKELGTFRAETLSLVQNAILVTNDTWRRVRFNFYRDARDEWQSNFRACEGLLGNKARTELRRLSNGFNYFEEAFLRMPMGGLAFAECRRAGDHEDQHFAWSDPETPSEHPGFLPKEYEVDFFAYLKRISDDPHFMTR